MLVLMHVRLFASAELDAGFIAHKWGTFTSVQGADGVQLEWNPLVTSELPKFVYDRNRPAGSAALPPPVFVGKGAMVTLQRMETPVIYFYSGRERTVDVTVKFPQGIVTEWFPQAAKSELKQMRWDQIHLLPAKSNPNVADLLPTDGSGNHYFAARETDSDFLRIKNSSKQNDELEKFIFYRGVGQFKAPLQVTLSGTDDIVLLKNAGTEPLSHLYVLYLRHGKGKYIYVDRLPSGGTQTVNLALQGGQSPASELRPRLAKEMAASLTREGLFDREASAMVKTWDDSWFGEEGLRVLYTLPRAWTDRTLPLTLSPQPTGLVRVMVGRAEMITHAMEWQLMKEVVRYSEPDSQAKDKAVASARALSLGRFTDAAVRKLESQMLNREFSQTAWELVKALAKPADPKLALAK